MTKGNALLTGITGFVGTYVTERLVDAGYDISGIVPPGEEPDRSISTFDRVTLLQGDLTSMDSLTSSIEKTVPGVIVHLAAESAPSKSFAMPERFFEVNVLGTQNLLEAARVTGYSGKIVIFTSSDIYGVVDRDRIPITEETPIAPLNPYSATKAACHLIAQQYSLNFGQNIIEVRPFNMLGPRQQPGFVLPDWASQVARILNKQSEPLLSVGRLTDQRDFVDVRDAARAVELLIDAGKAGEVYHICSGKGTVVQEILDTLLEDAGIAIEVRQDPSRLRPTRMPVVVGSHAKLSKATNWKPGYTLRETVHDTLQYWLKRLSA
jgi:GDP-4-dehydro-6-deoxy-D-mannose reductase